MDVMAKNDLSEIYHRQTILDMVGADGQYKICNAKVLVVGAGGLGSPLIQYIVAVGVGNIGIMDNDTVAIHNLHRQVLYNYMQIGKSKVECAKEYAEKLNPDCKALIYPFRLTDDNAFDIFKEYDIVVDCSDNLLTRYIIDKYTQKLGIPFVYGSLCEFKGKVAIFNYRGGVSYSDIYPFDEVDIGNFVQSNGIIGAFAGIVGTIQALEVIKLILGIPTLTDKIMLIDGLTLSFETIRLQ